MGAVLLGPFVDFTIPSKSASLSKNACMDWMVNQGVISFCGPIFAEKAGCSQSALKAISPLFGNLEGLCPMYISYSLHEGVTDMCQELVLRLRAAGNETETFTTPYLGHVFQAFSCFLPESQKAELDSFCWLQR